MQEKTCKKQKIEGEILMKKNKSTRGITLIALVITIIILLILAGISISALTNQGLFKNAKIAQNATERAEEEGKLLRKKIEKIIKKKDMINKEKEKRILKNIIIN